METSPNQITPEEAGMTLQLKRSLLPIDKYAAREGLSRGIIEECGKLGVVQIRKYKGKTFVVDVPLSPYLYTSAATKGATKPVDKGSHFAKRPQNEVPNVPKTAKKDTKLNDESIKAGTISALVEDMLHTSSETMDKPIKTLNDENGQVEKIGNRTQTIRPDARETIVKPAQSSNFSINAKKRCQVVSRMFRKASQIINKLTETVSGKSIKSQEKPQPTQIIQDDEIQFGHLAESSLYEESQEDDPAAQLKSKRTWRVVALFSIVFLLAALLSNIWFYMDKQIQLGKLDLAYANIQTVYNDLIKANQQVKVLQNELTNSRTETRGIQNELDKSRAEIKRIQNELDNSRAEAKTVRNELAEARQNLEIIQHRNTQGVDRLNKQIQKLTTWITESTKSPQPPSGSGISSE